MGFFRSFMDAYDGAESHYEVAGREVTCSHCGGSDFDESEAQLNTAGLTFFNLDWANRTAAVLVCRQCGHLEWFLGDVERVGS